MSLNAREATGGRGGDRVEQEPLEAGTYEGRVVQVIDLGIQKQRPYKGEPKPPKHCMRVTYELADEFMLDEEGNALEDKPRWVSEEFPLLNIEADLATSTKRYKAIDPADDAEGDWTRLLGRPISIMLTHEPKGDKVYNNIGGLAPLRKKNADKLAELVNEPVAFLISEPDMEVYNNFPKWLQKKVTEENMSYEGSALQAELEGTQAEAPEPKESNDEEEW